MHREIKAWQKAPWVLNASHPKKHFTSMNFRASSSKHWTATSGSVLANSDFSLLWRHDVLCMVYIIYVVIFMILFCLWLFRWDVEGMRLSIDHCLSRVTRWIRCRYTPYLPVGGLACVWECVVLKWLWDFVWVRMEVVWQVCMCEFPHFGKIN